MCHFYILQPCLAARYDETMVPIFLYKLAEQGNLT